MREAGVPELPGSVPLMTWASEVAAETPGAPGFCHFTQFQVLPASLSPADVTTQGRKMTEVGTEEMARCVKGLLSKHEDLSLVPSTQGKRWHLPVIPELGTGGRRVPGASWSASLGSIQ